MTDPTPRAPTLDGLAHDLASGRTTSRALVDACLARIDDPDGEGGAAFTFVDRDGALAAADAMDLLRRAGAAPSRFAGIPVAIKDLFDVQGQETRAGSTVLAGSGAVARDAPAVVRIRQAGFVLIGRTNMTEFAYSGLGLNPHYGTPRSPWRREVGHVAGGSSSGSAVAVADGMAHAALGTDTGGSCRIPAAFTGLVGLKPTARRVPLEGAVPLSSSLDSIGPIARSVACCAHLDAILSGESPIGQGSTGPSSEGRPLRGMRLAVATTLVLDGLDDAVAAAFDRALSRISAAGGVVERVEIPEFGDVAGINARGGLTASESHAWHRNLLAKSREGYDPRVSARILRGEGLNAADYIEIVAARTALVRSATRRLSRYDALLMPTVPVAPPTIAELQADEAYGRLNSLVLRNSAMINMIDGCALSLPIGEPGGAPVGLTVACEAMGDARMLAVAAAIEAALSDSPMDQPT